MSRFRMLATATAALSIALAGTVSADPGKGRGHDRDREHHAHHAAHGCPPGLAKKNPACVPPGQARHHDRLRYGRDVGDRLRIGDYVLVRDPARFDLQRRDGWRYYRSGDRVYRVDAETQQILAVIDLARALLN